MVTASRNGQHAPSEVLDKLPPHDSEAERVTIGAMASDPELARTLLTDVVKPDDFYHGAYAQMARAIQLLVDRGMPFDATIIANELRAVPCPRDNWASMIWECVCDALPSCGQRYAEIVANHARRRQLITATTALLRDAYQETIPTDRLLSIGRDRIAQIESRRPAAERYKRITMAELEDGDWELSYHIDGVLPVGQPTIVAAPRKGMKTSMAFDMAIAIATGGHWLGYFPVTTPGRVLFMSGESGEATLRDTGCRIARAAGKQLRDVTDNILSPDLPNMGSVDDLLALERFLKDDEIAVAFFDCAYLMMDGDEAGNLMKQGGLLRGLTKACQSCGVTPVLLHHMRRTDRASAKGQAPSLDDLSWAGFAEFARSWVLMDRTEEFNPETGRSMLDLSIGGSAGHCSRHAVEINEGLRTDDGGRKWDVSIMSASDARQDAQARKDTAKQQQKDEQLTRDREAILKAVRKLKDHTGTMTDIRARTTRNGQAFAVAFSSLVDDGSLVETILKKSNNREYPAFKLGDGTNGK